MFFILSALITFFSLDGHAAGNSSLQFINNSVVGEVQFDEYAGPLDPRFVVFPSRAQVELKDDVELSQFLEPEIQSSFFELSDFWLKESEPQISCPNSVFANSIDYIHYLYRLIAISYLQEAIREYAIAAQQMGMVAPDCSLDWDKSFAQCNPRTDDMKRFLSRIKGRHTMGMDMNRLVRLSKAQAAQQLNLFNQHLLSKQMNGIVERRLSFILPTHSPVSMDQFSQAIGQACKQDKLLVKNLCSEQDFYYGFSEVGIFSYLLQKSNTLSVINEGGYGEGCLKRYARINARREDKLDYLSPLSEVLFEQIRSGNLRYKQGSLFIAGALKEFDDKGLENFIYTQKKEEKKVVSSEPPPVVVAVAPAPAPIPEPEIVHEPSPVTPAPAVLVPTVKKISQFEAALERLDEDSRLESVSLDMSKFKDDFIFTPLMTEALKGPLQDFQTRQGLEDMAIGDKLGTYKEPVQLIFLKFLIDNNFHTGLFNVVAVLGERFYVRNDIDGKNRAVLIELKNDESTGFRWLITLVRPTVPAQNTKKK